LVVDVREPAEFAGSLGHIEGAVNIPLAQFKTAWDGSHVAGLTSGSSTPSRIRTRQIGEHQWG